MPMTPSGRANAIYNEIASTNPNFSELSTAEKNYLLSSLESIWGDGDLEYIQGNATVNTGIAVQVAVPSGTGSTVGTGTIS